MISQDRKGKMNLKVHWHHIIIWLCGLWALGLGFRMTLELCVSHEWIHVPKHWLNIYFDFLPLTIFGLIVTIIQTNALIRIIRQDKENEIVKIVNLLRNRRK